MAQEIRAMVQGLIIIVVLAGAMFTLLFGFINANGGSVPIAIQHNITSGISITNSTISGALGSANASTTSALNPSNLQGTSGVLGIVGYGGAITAFVGFFGALPKTMGYILQIFSATPILAMIMGGITGAIILLNITNVMFEIMSAINKYRM